jgi:hypothetical protein
MTIKKTKFDLIDLDLKDLVQVSVGVNEYWHYEKDYSILKEFTDEELAQELLRRTSLGKELE